MKFVVYTESWGSLGEPVRTFETEGEAKAYVEAEVSRFLDRNVAGVGDYAGPLDEGRSLALKLPDGAVLFYDGVEWTRDEEVLP